MEMMIFPLVLNTMMKRGKMNSIVSDQPPLEQEEPDDATFDLEPPPLKIKNFGEVIHSLEDVQAFLDSKGYSDQATVIASAIDLVASLHCNSLASARQTTFDEYF